MTGTQLHAASTPSPSPSAPPQLAPPPALKPPSPIAPLRGTLPPTQPGYGTVRVTSAPGTAPGGGAPPLPGGRPSLPRPLAASAPSSNGADVPPPIPTHSLPPTSPQLRVTAAPPPLPP